MVRIFAMRFRDWYTGTTVAQLPVDTLFKIVPVGEVGFSRPTIASVIHIAMI